MGSVGAGIGRRSGSVTLRMVRGRRHHQRSPVPVRAAGVQAATGDWELESFFFGKVRDFLREALV